MRTGLGLGPEAAAQLAAAPNGSGPWCEQPKATPKGKKPTPKAAPEDKGTHLQTKAAERQKAQQV